MNEIVGIDLGTTNSLIGVMEAGFPILIAHQPRCFNIADIESRLPLS